MRVRLEDVARATGVSPKTVSRVLNEEPSVKEATRQKVLAAMESMNYRPSPAARGLAGSRSFLVAMLYDNNDNPASTYLAEIQDGVLDACEAHRYSMMVCPLRMRGKDFVRRIDALVTDHHIDGVVLTPPLTDNRKLLARLQEHGVAHACISPVRHKDVVGVFMDEQKAASDLVTHLVGLGHRRIAHVVGIADHGASGWPHGRVQVCPDRRRPCHRSAVHRARRIHLRLGCRRGAPAVHPEAPAHRDLRGKRRHGRRRHVDGQRDRPQGAA